MVSERHEPTCYDTTAERWEEPERQAFDDSRVAAVVLSVTSTMRVLDEQVAHGCLRSGKTPKE